jgi:hypothetical protein
MAHALGDSFGFGVIRYLPARAANVGCILWAAIALVSGGGWSSRAYAENMRAGKPPKANAAGETPHGGGDVLKGDGASAGKGRYAIGARKGTCDDCLRGDIGCGQTITGSLAAGDCDLLGDGSYAETYRVVLSEPSRVTVSLSSASFDAYLLVTEEGCTESIAENDDCGSTDSCLVLDLAAGAYFVFANSVYAGETGSYTLSVACVPPLCKRCVVGKIACGETVTGTLSFGDCDFGDGSYVDVYRLDVAQKGFVTVALRSAELDPYLCILSADCVLRGANDDCDDTTYSSCLTLFLEAGTYFLYANCYDPGSTGAYELEVVACVCPAPDVPGDAFPGTGRSRRTARRHEERRSSTGPTTAVRNTK